MEDKKGHVKVTIEVEINENLMETMKDAIAKMNMKMPEMLKRREDK